MGMHLRTLIMILTDTCYLHYVSFTIANLGKWRGDLWISGRASFWGDAHTVRKSQKNSETRASCAVCITSMILYTPRFLCILYAEICVNAAAVDINNIICKLGHPDSFFRLARTLDLQPILSLKRTHYQVSLTLMQPLHSSPTQPPLTPFTEQGQTPSTILYHIQLRQVEKSSTRTNLLVTTLKGLTGNAFGNIIP